MKSGMRSPLTKIGQRKPGSFAIIPPPCELKLNKISQEWIIFLHQLPEFALSPIVSRAIEAAIARRESAASILHTSHVFFPKQVTYEVRFSSHEGRYRVIGESIRGLGIVHYSSWHVCAHTFIQT